MTDPRAAVRALALSVLLACVSACTGLGDELADPGPATGESTAANSPFASAGLVAYQTPTEPAGVLVSDVAGSTVLAAGAGIPGRQQTNPDWSPDGQRLVMAVSDGERDDLWTVAPDGSDPQLLLDCSGDCLYLDDPAWSPDGTKVLYSRIPYDDSGPTLETVAVSDRSTQVLITAEPGTFFSGPRWSPDGTQVVFERAEVDPADSGEVVGVSLLVASVADPDGDLRPLTDPKTFPVTPDWGPNGQLIVFSARPEPESEASDLYTVEPDGEGLTRVTRLAESGGSAVEPAWAPDGRRSGSWPQGRPEGARGLPWSTRPAATSFRRSATSTSPGPTPGCTARARRRCDDAKVACATCDRCDDGTVRLTDFWERMELTFGHAYARSWADDQHLAALGGLTVAQALAQGVDTREVWRAVCQHAPVPAHLR